LSSVAKWDPDWQCPESLLVKRRRERISSWAHGMTIVVLGSTISEPICRHGAADRRIETGTCPGRRANLPLQEASAGDAMTSESEQELKGPRSFDVWSRRDGTTVTINERVDEGGRRTVVWTVVVADKAKTVIVANDATDVARKLIAMCGGNVQAAHDAITRAARGQKRTRGKPNVDDTGWILAAIALRRRDGCSDNEALKRVADLKRVAGLVRNADKVEAMTRRMRNKLAGGTLEDFAQSPHAQAAGGADFGAKILNIFEGIASGRITRAELLATSEANRIILGT
jgi:hypothetical protein